MKKHAEFPSNMRKLALNRELLSLLPGELIREFEAFIFDISDNVFRIAAKNPNNPYLKKYIKDRLGNNFEIFIASDEDIKFVLGNIKRNYKEEIDLLAQSANENEENVTRIVDGIIEYALNEKTSDIHIEPLRGEIAVRFRIDGTLYEVLKLPHNILQTLVARIKIISGMRIDEYRRPQDGRIEPEDHPNISLRVSTMPTLFGEKIVMRIMDDTQKDISIEELGFTEAQKNIILQNIEKPYGMVISSGPTGSGKTTTIYALLREIKKDGLNISTLEDPIEYVLNGVNQIQINTHSGLTFPIGLRSLLRQDPDIIMVGEIRDSETANMASNAAMTGHVVFTTMHTNDAASAFTRLLEMKVDDFVVSSTINLVIAQRLVRKICPECMERRNLDESTIRKILARKDIVENLEKRDMDIMQNLRGMEFLHGRGCKACFETGYSGRIGIFELLTPNKELHNLILNHRSAEAIRESVKKDGFTDMISDGIEKIFRGLTTFEEVLRTTKNI